MAPHNEIAIISHVYIRNSLFDARLKQAQGLPLVWANAGNHNLGAVNC